MSKEKKEVLFFVDTLSNKRFDIYISGDITEPKQYIEIFDVLRNAQRGDEIRMFFNSGGGNLWTAMQFISCMNSSDALIEGIIEGECHSAASLIFLSCHNFDVPEFGTMLCHYCTSGYRAKGHELSQWFEHSEPHLKNIFKNIYKDFFNKEEIEEMINGKDFWLDGNEIVKRLKRKVEEQEKPEKPKKKKGKKK